MGECERVLSASLFNST